MNSIFKLVILSLFGMSVAIGNAQTDLETGISYYDKRAEKHDGLKVDSININLAISHFNKAIVTGTKAEKS